MPHFIKVATADELADQRQWLLCPERHLHPSKGTVVGRDGRGSRSDLSVARSDVRHQDRGGPGTARWEAVKSYPVRVTGPDIEIEL